jgi:hypothetical protein
MKLIIETKYETYTTDFKNIDVSLDQLFNAFKGHLVSLGWHPMMIDRFIIELADELTPDKESGYEE